MHVLHVHVWLVATLKGGQPASKGGGASDPIGRFHPFPSLNKQIKRPDPLWQWRTVHRSTGLASLCGATSEIGFLN